MIKKLLALSTVIGAAAYLQDKERRDRLVCSAQDFIKGARAKLDKGIGSHDSTSSASTTGAGATSRYSATTPHVPAPRNGIY